METERHRHKALPAFETIFRALNYRNFRIFFAGQTVSLVGTWMQQVAMSWLVYRLTNSAFILGVVGFASQIPTFILSPVAGVLTDRWDKRRMLILTQTLSMIQAFVLATLVFKGAIAVWHIIVLGVFLGAINSLDIPARQSFLIDMVERKEVLGNAIALNSLMFNMARLIGPSIAGLIIAMVGEGTCFFVNGLSFLAVILSLSLMKIIERAPKVKKSRVLYGIKEGFNYTFGFPPIRAILALLSVISLMGMSYVTLMPVFAKNVLGGGPSTLGFLMAATGIGALTATIFLASRKRVLKLGNIIPVSSSIFAVGVILFSLSRTLWVSMALLAVAGFGFMIHMASANTILQTIVDDDKRGRVMSFYTMAFMGMAPLGSLFGGTLAAWIGATNALIIGGVVCILASMVFAGRVKALKKMVHPIYERMAEVSAMVTGVNMVTELTVPPED